MRKFSSHPRDDDEPFVEQLHDDLTKYGFDRWWYRQTMQSRGRTFLQELRDVIEGSDRPISDKLSKFHCPDFQRERPYNESLEGLSRIISVPVPPHEYSWG